MLISREIRSILKTKRFSWFMSLLSCNNVIAMIGKRTQAIIFDDVAATSAILTNNARDESVETQLFLS